MIFSSLAVFFQSKPERLVRLEQETNAWINQDVDLFCSSAERLVVASLHFQPREDEMNAKMNRLLILKNGFDAELANLKLFKQEKMAFSSSELLTPHPGCLHTEFYDVDWILVHGLNGDRLGTWTHENGFCWPLNLAKKLSSVTKNQPRIRILTVSHNLSFKETNPDYDLEKVVELFFLAMRSLRVSEKPIIWFAHSLGGIVVKEILFRSPKLLEKTAGVCFLGTPHRGASGASVLKAVEISAGPLGLIRPFAAGLVFNLTFFFQAEVGVRAR